MLFKGFDTSAAILKRQKWRVKVSWKPLNEDGVTKFIKTPPRRDRRELMDKNRLRLLLIQYTKDEDQLYKHEELLNTAKHHGWISEGFTFLTQSKHQTAGVVVPQSEDQISIAIQAPRDDFCPFFCLSLMYHYTEGRKQDGDWLCLFFAGPEMSLETVESLLCGEPLPSDFEPPLSADFMFFPASLLHWQVGQMTDGIDKLSTELFELEKKIQSLKDPCSQSVRAGLSKIYDRHDMLKRRGRFAHDLGGELGRCFDRIEKWASKNGVEARYSVALRYKVQTDAANLSTILHELDTTSSRVQAQRTMINDRTSIIPSSRRILR